jgi:uncharacterized membrane protein
VESIDLVRGLVMIVMALDHVRDYVHFDSLLFSPTDLARTTPALFATRFITHLCAPTFMLLAGTSIWFVARRKTPRETSAFLLTRGLWIALVQLTIVRFAWSFDPAFRYNSASILWAIGLCMVAMAALVRVRFEALLAFGFILIVGHDAFDRVSFAPRSAADVVWTFLHAHKTYDLGHGRSFQFLYPFVPWIGVMALGFCLGRLYDEDVPSGTRRSALLRMGSASLLSFLALRLWNVYGDPVAWTPRTTRSATVMSFLNLEKYPPSLLYLLVTLGTALLLLAFFEGRGLAGWTPLVVFGRAAFFYYVVHVLLAHLIGLVAVVVSGRPWQTMVFTHGPHTDASPLLAGTWGFSLLGTYVAWIALVVAMYPLCRAWLRLKNRNKSRWWVSYV